MEALSVSSPEPRPFEAAGRFPALALLPSRQANGGGGIMVHELVVEIELTARKGD